MQISSLADDGGTGSMNVIILEENGLDRWGDLITTMIRPTKQYKRRQMTKQ